MKLNKKINKAIIQARATKHILQTLQTIIKNKDNNIWHYLTLIEALEIENKKLKKEIIYIKRIINGIFKSLRKF